jgi:hypothetical protein
VETQVKVSICASAAKPQHWEHLYKSIKPLRDGYSFEFVFCGPISPLDPKFNFPKLPDNLIWIKSDVKPSQCFEIAARASTGDLIMCMFDDAEFIDDGNLQRLIDIWEQAHDPYCMVTPRYKLNHCDQSYFAHKFFVQDQTGPTLPIAGLIGRGFYFKSGGVDKNFIAVMWDVDLGMRSYEAGSQCIFSDVYINEIKEGPDSFSGEVWAHDRTFLESMWSDHPKQYLVRKSRTQPVESFPQCILTDCSIGPTINKWR